MRRPLSSSGIGNRTTCHKQIMPKEKEALRPRKGVYLLHSPLHSLSAVLRQGCYIAVTAKSPRPVLASSSMTGGWASSGFSKPLAVCLEATAVGACRGRQGTALTSKPGEMLADLCRVRRPAAGVMQQRPRTSRKEIQILPHTCSRNHPPTTCTHTGTPPPDSSMKLFSILALAAATAAQVRLKYPPPFFKSCPGRMLIIIPSPFFLHPPVRRLWWS